MMDRVRRMTQDRKSPATYFLYFTQRVAKNKSEIVCFFEGEDSKYYAGRLNLLLNDLSWSGIDCGGKKNVLSLYGLINDHEEYKNARVAFFVDRDFDDPLPPLVRERVYETPSYSIENFYCSRQCLSQILAVEFKLANNHDRPGLLCEVLDQFCEMQRLFHGFIRPLNVWIKAHRLKERKEGCRPLNLNNIQLADFVNVDVYQVTGVETDIAQHFPGCYDLNSEELGNAESELDSCIPYLMFRGKYELEFVRLFLAKLKSDCVSSASKFFNPGASVRLNITKQNLISELSQYAETPPCLKEYISELAA